MKTARLGPGNLCKNNSSQNSQDTATVSWSEALASIFRSWARRSSCWQSCTCLCSYLLYLWYSQMFVEMPWTLHLWVIGDIITSWKRGPSLVMFDYQNAMALLYSLKEVSLDTIWWYRRPTQSWPTHRFPTSPDICVMISFLATFIKVHPRKNSPINIFARDGMHCRKM